MIIHHTDTLHEGIDDGAANKADGFAKETAFA